MEVNHRKILLGEDDLEKKLGEKMYRKDDLRDIAKEVVSYFNDDIIDKVESIYSNLEKLNLRINALSKYIVNKNAETKKKIASENRAFIEHVFKKIYNISIEENNFTNEIIKITDKRQRISQSIDVVIKDFQKYHKEFTNVIDEPSNDLLEKAKKITQDGEKSPEDILKIKDLQNKETVNKNNFAIDNKEKEEDLIDKIIRESTKKSRYNAELNKCGAKECVTEKVNLAEEISKEIPKSSKTKETLKVEEPLNVKETSAVQENQQVKVKGVSRDAKEIIDEIMIDSDDKTVSVSPAKVSEESELSELEMLMEEYQKLSEEVLKLKNKYVIPATFKK